MSHPAAAVQRPKTTPPDGMEALPDAMTVLTQRTSKLVKAAALHLGLGAAQAEQVGQTATFAAGENTITVLPIGETDDGALSLMLSVVTRQAIAAPNKGLHAAAVLQHAPGALNAFSAALGATSDGYWMLHRSLIVAPHEGEKLAQALTSTLRLIDFVFDPAVASGL